MKVQYYTATTLDGYIADSEHSLDWLFQFESLEDTSYPAFIADVGAVVMGSSTYKWLLKHHVYADPEKPKPWPYELPAWIFSSRPQEQLPGANTKFVQGDVMRSFPAIQESAGKKNIWVAGGGDLVGQFYDCGLLDEIIVQIAPVTLGKGAPVLPRRIDKPPLEVLSVTPYKSGLVEVHYRVSKKAGAGAAGA